MTIKCVKYINGDKEWFLNDLFHREDGPAVDQVGGHKEWWLNGQLHRVNGPAREFPNGSKQWWLNGKLHRIDGPAVEYADGTKGWYLNDEFLFALSQESQPFVFIEETEDKQQIKVLTQKGTEFWKNVPGLKELADNWEKIKL